METIQTEAVENCPHCGCDNIFINWDVETQGYVATCWQCGREIFLCDECLHADDNPGRECDWSERIVGGKCTGGHCFRGNTNF